jgi:hypothetical protein
MATPKQIKWALTVQQQAYATVDACEYWSVDHPNQIQLQLLSPSEFRVYADLLKSMVSADRVPATPEQVEYAAKLQQRVLLDMKWPSAAGESRTRAQLKAMSKADMMVLIDVLKAARDGKPAPATGLQESLL